MAVAGARGSAGSACWSGISSTVRKLAIAIVVVILGVTRVWQDQSIAVFRVLAEAEAKIHGMSIEDVSLEALLAS